MKVDGRTMALTAKVAPSIIVLATGLNGLFIGFGKISVAYCVGVGAVTYFLCRYLWRRSKGLSAQFINIIVLENSDELESNNRDAGVMLIAALVTLAAIVGPWLY